jgi:hypothetical protein
MLTPYNRLSNAELIRCHRYDIQGDPLVEELWTRLEALAPAEKPVETKYVEEQFRYGTNP